MQFVRFDQTRLGLLVDDGDGIVDLSTRFDLSSTDPLVDYLRSHHDASEFADASPDVSTAAVAIQSPIRRPGKIVAAPLNYREHTEESLSDEEIGLEEWATIEQQGYFLKAPSSVIGPEDTIELPFADRRVDHEVELAFVVGDDCKDVDAEEALDHVFGYTILLDVTVRGDESRSYRKSFDSFTVIGPAVVTPDEIENPQSLSMTLDVNGEVRQDANTSQMIYSCADIVAFASTSTTLEAGDVVTTGTPDGVSPIVDGDSVTAAIERIGSLHVDVVER